MPPPHFSLHTDIMQLHGMFPIHTKYVRYNSMSCFNRGKCQTRAGFYFLFYFTHSLSVTLAAKTTNILPVPQLLSWNVRPCQGNTHSFSPSSCRDDDILGKHKQYEIQTTNPMQHSSEKWNLAHLPFLTFYTKAAGVLNGA